ncbi:MAG: ATPase [Prevotella sp.]
MIIIADSGSTKTDWCIIRNGEKTNISTSGMNPVVMSEDDLRNVIKQELLPRMISVGCTPQTSSTAENVKIYFYGAGCTVSCSSRIETALQSTIGYKAEIEVNSDMLGAARSLFGNREGIACILGTGSNSCVYDGRKIVRNIPALGYILGDEGSGAVLGRMFLNAIFKGGVSERIRNEYLSTNSVTINEVIERVYRGATPNRFLASVSLFIARHLDNKDVRQIVVDNFRAFFRNNIQRYGRNDLSVGIVGSIAYAYQDILIEVAQEEHVTLDSILKSPMQNLIAYHTDHVSK